MKLYVLSLHSIHQKTNEMLELDLKIHNLKYNKNFTMEQYIKYQEGWLKNSTKYTNAYGEENAYFNDLNEAIYAAEHNLADVNEAGVYNYITIIEYPMNKMYAFSEPTRFLVFKYNKNSDGYDEVTDTNDEIYQLLANAKCCKFLINNKPKINLNLSKEEELSTKEFVDKLKENLDKKDYKKVKEMIDEKEVSTSIKINSFVDDISSSFHQVDNAVNKIFDVLNGNF